MSLDAESADGRQWRQVEDVANAEASGPGSSIPEAPKNLVNGVAIATLETTNDAVRRQPQADLPDRPTGWVHHGATSNFTRHRREPVAHVHVGAHFGNRR